MTLPKISFDHVKITLVLVLVYIVAAPLVPFVLENAVWTTIALAVIAAFIALLFKARVDVIIACIIALGFFIAKLVFPKTDDSTLTFRTAAILAFLFLQFTLLIGPWSRFTKYFLHIYKHRRHFGVTAFLLACLHASIIYNIYFQYSPKNAFQTVFVFFGATTLTIMSFLALTSWDYLQKHVSFRSWKIVHVVSLLFYLGMLSFFWKTAGDSLEPWHKMFLIMFLIFWVLVAPWSLPRKILRKVNGWKQLHMLIYIGYASIIIHIWTGTAMQQKLWVQALFWILVALVVGSHAVGWVMMFRQYLRGRKQSKNTITVEGKTYYSVDRLDSFTEGKGRRFDIQSIPLAFFLHEGKVIALSNTCAHQGGPISQGEIVNGYVECPWHRFQFSVKDGFGPPGFKDCIPYYPVHVQDGMVYVSMEPCNNCTKH